MADSEGWSIQDSAALYGLDRWGEPYFTINGRGHISVQPQGERGGSLDLVELVSELRGRNLGLPLLIRFDDILEDRLERLHAAFERAIAQYSYTGRYQGVFPVKCNQQRHVVEELVICGKRWNFGLEAGSKAELLIALSLLDDPEALLICNGYKDRLYIETAILARRLGRQPVVVIEQPDEVDRIIEASKSLGAAPYIGVRAKLSSRSTGRWGSSVGDKAKFGLSIPELLATVERLRESNLLPDLRLLHFHIGSQINDIAVLKDALQEAGQIYVELTRLGAPMGFLDVGGGLGIDYDGSRTASAASTNYSLQNYANDVVATVRECCEPNGVAVPTLVSESGRAIASHFSLLVFDVLGQQRTPSINSQRQWRRATHRSQPAGHPLHNPRAIGDGRRTVGAAAGSLERCIEVQAGCARRIPARVHGSPRPRHSRTTDVGLCRCDCTAAPEGSSHPGGAGSAEQGVGWDLLRQLVDLSLSTRHLGHRSAVSGGAHPAAGSNAQPTGQPRRPHLRFRWTLGSLHRGWPAQTAAGTARARRRQPLSDRSVPQRGVSRGDG